MLWTLVRDKANRLDPNLREGMVYRELILD
jgi:hypothetical protein